MQKKRKMRLFERCYCGFTITKFELILTSFVPNGYGWFFSGQIKYIF
jgi:hypothetical protein